MKTGVRRFPLVLAWRQRALLRAFVAREISSRYAGSIGGMLWALVHPLVLLALYALVFGAIFRVRFPELEQHPFVIFVAAGLWPWLAFQESVQRGAQAVLNNTALVKRVAFEHELVVYAAVLATFLVHAGGFALVLLVLALMGYGIHLAALPWTLLILVLLMLFSAACALVLCAIQVFVRDVDHLLTHLMSLLFFATPILYPISLVPPWLRTAMEFNPMVHFVEPLRSGLLFGDYAVSWGEGLLWAASLPLLWLAALFFRRLSPHFEDFL